MLGVTVGTQRERNRVAGTVARPGYHTTERGSALGGSPTRSKFRQSVTVPPGLMIPYSLTRVWEQVRIKAISATGANRRLYSDLTGPTAEKKYIRLEPWCDACGSLL